MINYIKMCCVDTDIQPIWKPTIGHKFVQKDNISKIFTVINAITEEIRKELIWLPSQEDLQIILAYDSYGSLLKDLTKFIKKYDNIYSQMSANEILFSFTKLKLFDKIWESDKWIALN